MQYFPCDDVLASLYAGMLDEEHGYRTSGLDLRCFSPLHTALDKNVASGLDGAPFHKAVDLDVFGCRDRKT